MKDLNPYVEARREWNDRYLDLVRARRWWQVAAVSELALVATLGGGLVAVSLQHKTVPYVVEVDALGAAVAVKPAEAARRPRGRSGEERARSAGQHGAVRLRRVRFAPGFVQAGEAGERSVDFTR